MCRFLYTNAIKKSAKIGCYFYLTLRRNYVKLIKP